MARTFGATGRDTRIIRKGMRQILEGNINKLQDDLEQMTPKDRVQALLKLAEFVLPKPQSISIHDSDKVSEYKRKLAALAGVNIGDNNEDEDEDY